MSLEELFEKVDIVNNTRAAAARKIKAKTTIIVNESDIPSYLADQFKAIEAGVPQRITTHGYVVSHSVFKYA